MPYISQKYARMIIPIKKENCLPDNLPMKLTVIADGGYDRVNFTGHFSITENIGGDIYIVVDSSRCDLDRNNCEKLDTFTLKNVCTILLKKNGIFTEALSLIHPSLKCPFRVGNNTFDNMIFDMKVFSMVPIDGSVSN
jgi:hypothetical protein